MQGGGHAHAVNPVGAVLFQFSNTPQLITTGAGSSIDNEKMLNFQTILCELLGKSSDFSRDAAIRLIKIRNRSKIGWVNEF